MDAELQDVLRRYCSSLGSSFISKGSSKVLAQPSNRMLFAKTGAIDQVLGEAESLQAMFQASQKAGHSQTLIPTIHAFGKTSNGNKAFLVTDYRNLSSGLSRSNQRTLGQKLAEMHRHGTSENGMYGFQRATHCGATEQDNTWTASWSDFWADRRIGDLVRRSGDQELAALEVQLREKVYPLLFNKEAMKDVRPAIIHGDLWSGNAGTDEESGQPIIFDPSSSYSHNEAELGITKMFGGFGSEFYEAYHAVMPKAQPYYNERQDMYEAYHHLNHFVIFGGGYRSGTIRLFKKLIAWAEKENGKKSGRRDDDDDDDDGDDGEAGDSKKRRGLRGGNSSSTNASASYNAGCSSMDTLSHLHPQRPPSAGTVASTSAPLSNGPLQAVKEVTLPPATPSQIADYFSQMICYLWFSSGIPGRSLPTTPSRSPTTVNQPLQSSPLAPRRYIPGPFTGIQSIRSLRPSHAKTASAGNISTGLSPADVSLALQAQQPLAAVTSPQTMAINTKILSSDPALLRLQPKSRFLRFCREILRTTQVSTSVIALALIYVHRLKAAHPQLKGRDGSEFRLAISSLMLANKILDDNTYLNKTWAEISGMPLVEISKMEVEFWLGLKMELHITKDQYEKELQDLHTLANDRTLAVQQRDAAMKRAILQQQQQQLAAQSHQWTPYLHPGLSASSDGLFAFNDPRLQSIASHTAARHSMGYADETLRNHSFPEAFSQLHYPSHLQNSLPPYDMSAAPHGYNAHSPPFHSRPTTSFTLPPSPLSQASAGVPLNPAECGGLSLAVQAALQDVSASSPPFNGSANNISASSSTDPMWSVMHRQDNGLSLPSANGASTFMHSNELSPRSGTSNASFAFGSTQNSHDQRPSLSTQSSSTLSGLKRDFEKTNLESASPLDASQHPSKRFAAEPVVHDDLRYYQLASAIPTGVHNHSSKSPSGSRYALRSRTRASGPRAPNSLHSASHDASSSSSTMPVTYRMSLSPQHASAFSAHAPMPSSAARGSMSRPSTSHDAEHNQAPHPNYHSVFSSALTPNALAAPLDNSMMAQQRSHWNDSQAGAKKLGPLQYYSLAAGEAYGHVGTYLPPPSARQGWNTDVSGGGARRTSMVPDYRQVSNGQPKWNEASADWKQYSPSIHTPALGPAHQSCSSQVSHSMAPPSTAMHAKDDILPMYQGRDYQNSVSAPFSLDVNSWPLANPASSNFLFPYHLLPPQPFTSSIPQHHSPFPYPQS